MIFAFVAMFTVDVVNTRFFMSAKLFILKRWLRLLCFGMAFGAIYIAVLQQHNKAQMLLCGFLSLIFLETLFYWISICIASIAEKRFPHYFEEIENAWKSDKHSIVIKNKIQESGFKKSASIITKIEGETVSYKTCFDSEDKKIRLSVDFIKYASSWIISSTAYSETSDGRIYYTEASPLPYGLLYPPNFTSKRYPVLENPLVLLKKHKTRISKEVLSEIKDSPIISLKKYKESAEIENKQYGYVNKNPYAKEYFTKEGKIQIWKDMILVNYFPFLIS